MIRYIITILTVLFIFNTDPVYAINIKQKNIIKFGRNLIIAKDRIVRGAAAIIGNIIIEGTVEDDVVAVGGSVKLEKGASIGGNVVSVGGVIQRDPASKIEGNIVEVNIPGFTSTIDPFPGNKVKRIYWILKSSTFFGILFLAVLMVLIIPKPLVIIATRIEKDALRVIWWSIRGLLLIIPLAVILTMTIAGIFLIPLEVILVVGASLLGFFAIAQLVGKKLIELTKKPIKSMLLEMCIGITVLQLVGLIPFIGWIVKAVLILIGFGGVIASLFSPKKEFLPKTR